jgi:hypothetical protein
MAKGMKTGGRNFQKGVSGNPNGRPKLPPEIKQIQKMSPTFVRAMINKLSRMTKDELAIHLKDPKTPVLEVTLGSIYAKAIKDGDYMRLNFLLDRTIGKVKEEVDISVTPQITYRTAMTEDGRLLQEVIRDGIESPTDS